jgi:transcriptional regulator with XRE-family HTH domain
MDLSPFTRAGLRQKEIGDIVGVSNTTAGQWMRGQREVHHFITDRVSKVLDAVASAVDSGELPLSATVTRAERLDKIRNIVNQHM